MWQSLSLVKARSGRGMSLCLLCRKLSPPVHVLFHLFKEKKKTLQIVAAKEGASLAAEVFACVGRMYVPG